MVVFYNAEAEIYFVQSNTEEMKLVKPSQCYNQSYGAIRQFYFKFYQDIKKQQKATKSHKNAIYT